MKQCRHVELAALLIYCSIFSQPAVKPISHGRVYLMAGRYWGDGRKMYRVILPTYHLNI